MQSLASWCRQPSQLQICRPISLEPRPTFIRLCCLHTTFFAFLPLWTLLLPLCSSICFQYLCYNWPMLSLVYPPTDLQKNNNPLQNLPNLIYERNPHYLRKRTRVSWSVSLYTCACSGSTNSFQRHADEDFP